MPKRHSIVQLAGAKGRHSTQVVPPCQLSFRLFGGLDAEGNALRIAILISLLAVTLASLLLAITSGCGGGAPSSSTPTFSGNTNVTLLAASTANDTFWQLTATLQGLTLTSQSGKTVTVLTSPVGDEFIHLNGNIEPLATVSIPQDVYTSATLTLENAYPACTGQGTGVIAINEFGIMPAPAAVTVTLPQPITISGTSVGLILNLQVSPSIPPIGSCASLATPPSIVGSPVFTLVRTPLASQPTNSGNGKMLGLIGIAKAIAGSSMSVSSLGDVNAGPTPAWQFQLDSTTVYQGISGVSQLVAGLPIDMDAILQPDGSLLATRVEVLNTNPSSLSIAYGPLMMPYSSMSGTNALVEQSNGFISHGYDMYGFGGAQFRTSGQFTNLQSLPFTPKFDAATFAWGQNVLISSNAAEVNGVPPIPVPVTTATLIPQTIDGVVTATGSEGSFATYTISLAPYDLFPNLDVQPKQPTLVTNPGTVVVYADSNTQLNGTTAPSVGQTARFYGLVFNDGGTLRMDCAQISTGVQQ